MADQPFQITAAVLDTVRNLSAEGFKAREIAPRLGISETAIYAYIKRNIEFARAVAEGKKAFKDKGKSRRRKKRGREKSRHRRKRRGDQKSKDPGGCYASGEHCTPSGKN